MDRRNPINGDGFGVGKSAVRVEILIGTSRKLGWYDSIYDEELGSQPCIFTSVTPVSSNSSMYLVPQIELKILHKGLE